MTTTATRFDLETDHLMEIVERLQQSGHTERQISVAIGQSLRRPRRGWAGRLRGFGSIFTGAGVPRWQQNPTL